ncbi:Flavocytochrome c [Cucurbitaria berberidis CBS 394.84]|uniref:Fumarate reductase n=1 Tax=Cucurbitaria berberidis CBS 394.84 TaxID=1168544 RepID=A0A9P4GSH2_9PLEO|nr:Flavocytochrome c [Cucurbitaria berberidis CBS 394.84]KAF1850241.1 Flavocytochrome c [Cucurbitaria berberidis CBS 394.84]
MVFHRMLTVLFFSCLALTIAYLYKQNYPPMSAPIADPGMASRHAIVVGSGLAGLSAASQLISRNIPVRLLERGAKPGGNSIKASSGINGAPTTYQPVAEPLDAFYNDTTRSAGHAMSSFTAQREKLIETLTKNSAAGVEWLVQEKGVDLSRVAQLGGHSYARTHRGAGQAPPGFAIVSALLKQLKESPLFDLRTSCTVTKVLQDGAHVTGVAYAREDGKQEELHGPVIFASGGFGGDAEGLLAKYRPDLAGYPSTNDPRPGTQPLLTAIGAQLIDMDQVQVHPTGFVDPANAATPLKFLGAEVLRGEGGILLLNGKRFVDELDTREKVSNAITTTTPSSESPKQWTVQVVLDEGTYQAAKSHIDFYLFKGLMKKSTIAELGPQALESITQYAKVVAGEATDEFHRTTFANWTLKNPTPESVVYVGVVTPVVHFTMGGVLINVKSEVLGEDEKPIKGLWGAGEVTGGVHGGNRLGGSSLLECVVFGRIAGDQCADYLAGGK